MASAAAARGSDSRTMAVSRVLELNVFMLFLLEAMLEKFLTSSFFFFMQKTAYEISECDWSSDVCSSDLKQKTAYEISELQSHSEISYAVFCLRSEERRPRSTLILTLFPYTTLFLSQA